MTLGGKEPCGSKECTGTHFSQTQGPGLQNEATVEK